MAELEIRSGFEKLSTTLKQSNINMQHLVDGASMLNSRNIVSGKIVDYNQVLYGYTVSESSPIDETEGILHNFEIAEIPYNENVTGRPHTVYVRIPLLHEGEDPLANYLTKISPESDNSSASSAFGVSSGNVLQEDKKTNTLLNNHTRCVIDPTVADPTVPVGIGKFVGIRFIDPNYQYGMIVTIPNSTDIFAAIESGDLSKIFGSGAGLGFSTGIPGAISNYTAKKGTMILIGASTLQGGVRREPIKERLKAKGFSETETIFIANGPGSPGRDLAYASSEDLALTKGGQGLRWFIPQLLKVLSTAEEKQRYANFSYVVFGFPNGNDFGQINGSDREGAIRNTKNSLNKVGDLIDPITNKKISESVKAEELGTWMFKMLKLLCPNAEIIYIPCAARWGGGNACLDARSSIQYIEHLGYHSQFKIIKHLLVGSHHVAGRDKNQTSSDIVFSHPIGGGGTTETKWNEVNGVSGMDRQNDALVDIATGAQINHFLNANSSYPIAETKNPYPITPNLRQYCEKYYPKTFERTEI